MKQGTRFLASPQTRADHDCTDPLIREGRFGIGTALDDRGRQPRYRCRGDQANIASSTSGSRCGRQGRGAGHFASEQRHIAATIFVVVWAKRAKSGPSQPAKLADGVDADVCDNDAAHVARGRLQKVSRLQRAKCDRQIIVRDRRKQAAVVACRPAWKIDGDFDPGDSREAGKRICRLGAKRARETGAEQGIDQQWSGVGAAERLDRAGPGFPRLAGRDCGHLANGCHADFDTVRGKMACNNKAVAAIVTGAAQDQSRRGPGVSPDRLGRSGPRPLHQSLDSSACRDLPLLGRAHFGCSEDDIGAHWPFTVAGSRYRSPSTVTSMRRSADHCTEAGAAPSRRSPHCRRRRPAAGESRRLDA
jgi:hypothetical protein